MPSTSKPEYSVRIGGIQLSVWTNETSKGVMRSITMDKSYKDAKGEWQRTKNFKDSDLPKIAIGINKVMEFLWVKDTTQSGGGATVTPDDF